MPYHNLTTLAGSETVYDLATYANDATDGMLFALMLFAVFFVMLLAVRRTGFEMALLSAGFVCMTIGGVLAYAGFVSMYVVVIFMGITIFSALYMFIAKKG